MGSFNMMLTSVYFKVGVGELKVTSAVCFGNPQNSFHRVLKHTK